MTGPRGGRPRDPNVDNRILTAATRLIGTLGVDRFTADEVAATAGVGKASIYRRWPNLDELLLAVVERLGIGDVNYLGEAAQTSTRVDLFHLLAAATTGPSALAEAALLSRVGVDEKLRKAYARGPIVRFFRACEQTRARAAERGERWPALDPVLAGWTSLLCRIAQSGEQSNTVMLEDTIDRVVLPALRAGVPA